MRATSSQVSVLVAFVALLVRVPIVEYCVAHVVCETHFGVPVHRHAPFPFVGLRLTFFAISVVRSPARPFMPLDVVFGSAVGAVAVCMLGVVLLMGTIHVCEPTQPLLWVWPNRDGLPGCGRGCRYDRV